MTKDDKWNGYVPTPKLRKLGLLPKLKSTKPFKPQPGEPELMHPRLIGRVDDTRGPNACWPWLGGRDKDGYGIVSGALRAHRLAWEWEHGIPAASAWVVRHSCDHPYCCNPRHLLCGTAQENVDDRVVRERSARGAHNGRSKLVAAEVLQIFKSPLPATKTARAFGINERTVRDIRSGQIWGWLTEPYSKINSSFQNDGRPSKE